jgi:SAM-dependent methyltransferase
MNQKDALVQVMRKCRLRAKAWLRWHQGKRVAKQNARDSNMSALDNVIHRFDEDFYLSMYEDVRSAVEGGRIGSGHQHFIARGFKEGRRARLDRGALVPPMALRQRVHGHPGLLGFLQIGDVVSRDIITHLANRIALSPSSRILDFGCGCGRIMTPLRPRIQGQFFGSDIDKEAIDWCSENMHEIGSFKVNSHMPPLPFDTASFDFVYSISIFTHLPEAMQKVWIDELRRISKPGALLFLTTHGDDIFPFDKVNSDVARRFRDTGFHYSPDKTYGLPEFYGTSFISRNYINCHWSSVLSIDAIIPKGIANNQDLVICHA